MSSTKSTSQVLRTHNLSDKLALEVRLDDTLNAAILVLNTPDLPKEMLLKVRDQIKMCYGDEFNVVEVDSKPKLAKILLIDSSELTQNMLNNILKYVETKLVECGIVNFVEELVKEYERTKAAKRSRGSRSSKK